MPTLGSWVLWTDQGPLWHSEGCRAKCGCPRAAIRAATQTFIFLEILVSYLDQTQIIFCKFELWMFGDIFRTNCQCFRSQVAIAYLFFKLPSFWPLQGSVMVVCTTIIARLTMFKWQNWNRYSVGDHDHYGCRAVKIRAFCFRPTAKGVLVWCTITVHIKTIYHNLYHFQYCQRSMYNFYTGKILLRHAVTGGVSYSVHNSAIGSKHE
jgi:hypothetical protein